MGKRVDCQSCRKGQGNAVWLGSIVGRQSIYLGNPPFIPLSYFSRLSCYPANALLLLYGRQH